MSSFKINKLGGLDYDTDTMTAILLKVLDLENTCLKKLVQNNTKII